MKKSGGLIVPFSKILAFFLRISLSSRYRVSVKGAETVSRNSPVLYLPNHQALIDPVILLSQIYRFSTVSPVIAEKYYTIPIMKWYFQRLGAISVSDLEKGSRDTQVLKTITRSVYKELRRNQSIVIYPSGQISGQGYEKISNKKSAYHIVRKLPAEAQIIGVRMTGLWGSMWSRAKTGKPPNLFFLLLRSIFYVLVNLLFFVPKRPVSIECEDITASARERAALGQKEFNSFLEAFYNLHGEETAHFLKHYFFFPTSKG